MRTRMKRKVLGAVLTLIVLPGVLAVAATVEYRIRNRSHGSIVSLGEKREYILHVPAGYDPSRPVPLVISMHGAGGWPAQQRDISRWGVLADREGFLVVYPGGLARPGGRVWQVTPGSGLPKDVQFIADLIDELAARYNIDRSRIYANGLSNGAGMSFVLSCTMSDRIAAVGMVAAAQTLPWDWCADERPVPMITIHGTEDPVTPYHGGVSFVAPRAFPDIPSWTASWAQRNGCDPNPVDSVLAPEISHREYTNCANGADVVLLSLGGVGHVWPGGKPLPEWFLGPNSDFDANAAMWTFFRQHRLQE